MTALRLPLTPFAILDNFLSREERTQLWDWTMENRASFRPSTLRNNVLDPKRRSSETIFRSQFAGWPELFQQRIEPRLDELFTLTGREPFRVEHYEISLVAHGDGAHFYKHSDIPVGPGRKPLGGDGTGEQDRLISLVYYFHAEPRGFTGGELRLHRLGSKDEPGDYVDVDPLDNRLVAFHSWAEHEVRPVSVPSGRFEDQRFAVNCWLCAKLGRS